MTEATGTTGQRATPLFVCGSGRSGTTALHRLLATHDELALTNEAGVADLLRVMTELAAVPHLQPFRIARGEEVVLHGYVGAPYVDTAARIVRQHAIAAFEQFYRETFPDRAYRYFGDKLPEPETAIALQAVYPDLRLIVLARDPRDVLCSMRSFGARTEVARENRFLGEATAASVGPYWANVYDGLTRYGRHVFTLRYEDLVGAPVEHAERVLAWLGLPVDPAQRARMADASGYTAHGTARSAAASVGRWRRELSATEVAEIEAVAGAVMQRFGYELATS
ncbi:MAG: sulfotransferase [Planctomycetes bacterium]|nr:sulfotransferase [Planctomycetota bacterium]